MKSLDAVVRDLITQLQRSHTGTGSKSSLKFTTHIYYNEQGAVVSVVRVADGVEAKTAVPWEELS